MRFEDIYPEVAARLLTARFAVSSVRFESYDFAVSGYDTDQEL